MLDEATSELDNDTEYLIGQRLARIGSDRATIIVAHRLATVECADEILFMDRGRICARGTHRELLSCYRPYWQLWHEETDEQPVDPLTIPQDAVRKP